MGEGAKERGSCLFFSLTMVLLFLDFPKGV